MNHPAVTRRHFLGTAAGALALASLARGQVSASDSPVPYAPPARRTNLSIEGSRFLINSVPTYAGRSFRGHSIEGLLLNARMVQGICDDLNAQTAARWAYPDTGRWDCERNNREFLAAMPVWRAHGLLAFTINLQGGIPAEDADEKTWLNSAFTEDGSLRPAYMARLERILDFADELGMAVIVGYFNASQSGLFRDEAAVIKAIDLATRWLLERNYTHVLVQLANETRNAGYRQKILRRDHISQAIRRVQQHTLAGRRLLAGTSYPGNVLPTEDVVAISDFILLHGNDVDAPDRIRAMVRRLRHHPAFKPKPVLFTADDHFDFEQPDNNFLAALSEGVSWGYADPSASDYATGYEYLPVNWGLSSPRKRAFFGFLKEITGI